MPDSLNLTLPERNPTPSPLPKAIIVILACLLLVTIVNLILTLQTGGLNFAATSNQPNASGMPLEALKELALKLEKQALTDQAATVWLEYIAQSDGTKEEQARIWYRIGKLQQQARQFAPALAAFYRSEALVELPQLQTEINRRTQECLEALGKFAALRYELMDRVATTPNQQTAGGDVLAEIGSDKITKQSMDRYTEEQIEQQLQTLAAYLPEAQKNAQKEAMLKRLATTDERKKLLQQRIVTEVLYRKAREDGLSEDPKIRRMLQDTERAILAQKLLDKTLTAQIKISDGDLKSHYKANKTHYWVPEQALISHIVVKDQAALDKVKALLDQGSTFESLAQQHSIDEATKTKQGVIEQSIRRGAEIPGIGISQDASNIIFSTKSGQVAEKTIISDKGIHLIKVRQRQEKNQKSFDEAKQQVFQDLHAQKEREVKTALFTELQKKYDVVIHNTHFVDKPAPEQADVDPHNITTPATPGTP